MAYSRIVNVEYRSEKDMELFLSKWKDWMPKHMPVATSRTMVKTGPSSSLLMAVYASSEVAENAREVEVFLTKIETICWILLLFTVKCLNLIKF